MELFWELHLSISRSSKTKILCAKGRVIPNSTPSTLVLSGGQTRHWTNCRLLEWWPDVARAVEWFFFLPSHDNPPKGYAWSGVDIVQISGTVQARLFDGQKFDSGTVSTKRLVAFMKSRAQSSSSSSNKKG